MYLQKMNHTFYEEKNFEPDNINLLLDYCKQCYINNKIDIVFYRNVLKELYEVGAYSPNDMENYEPNKT